MKHCWHETIELDPHKQALRPDHCCWCGSPEIDMAPEPGHGRFGPYVKRSIRGDRCTGQKPVDIEDEP